MTFYHDAPSSLVPGINFLEFLVRALSIQKQAIIADSESAKNASKNHTASAENSLYFLVNDNN